MIVARQGRRQTLYRKENIAGIRLPGVIAMIENFRGGLGYGKRHAGCILDQARSTDAVTNWSTPVGLEGSS